jgi:hypothetical protein
MAVLVSLCHMLKCVELGRLLPSEMVTGATCNNLLAECVGQQDIEDTVVVRLKLGLGFKISAQRGVQTFHGTCCREALQAGYLRNRHEICMCSAGTCIG